MTGNALVIAGGVWQLPLIQFLKGKGYRVTVVDPYSTSKGVLVCDHHIQLDVREKEQILAQIDREYDLVCTDQSDISVGTVSYLAKRLGLNGNDEEVVEKFSNKYRSRQYAKSIGVPCPDFTSVRTLREMKAFIQNTGYPLMIKPCDSQSSKGIHRIDAGLSDAELQACLDDALQYSFIGEAILEQFLTGYEITVDGFCAYGKHQVLAISKKKHFKTGIASTLTYPAPLPEELEERIIQTDNRYVEESGLMFGPTHAEYMVDEEKDEFSLVEIACRGGGTLLSSNVVPWVSGFDTYDAFLKCLTGNPVDIAGFKPLKRSAELHFFDFGDGEITMLSGIEEAAKTDGVLLLDFDFQVGDVLKSCQDDRSRQGFVIVLADSPTQLQERIQRVCNTIQIALKP